MSNKKKSSSNKVGIAEAIRDVFITSINRGQLPVLGLISIILLIIYKIPSADIIILIHDIVHELGIISILSYLLNIGIVIAWSIHAKSVRQMHSNECARIGREKTELQRGQLNHKKVEEEN